MKSSAKLLIAIILSGAFATGALHAQATSNSYAKLAAAFALDTAGHPAQAIAAAEELLASGTLSRVEQSDALDLEGMCYVELDRIDKAVHALEAAGALLGPQDIKEHAAILDNLGRIYATRGNYDAAAHLYDQSAKLFEAAGDHGGLTRVANNQAEIALSQMKNGKARKYLDRADRESKQASNLDKDDFGALASMHGWLALNEGDTHTAVDEYRRALSVWRDFHGEQHPLTAWGTLLLGQAEALDGQPEEGARTMAKGLALVKATAGDRSRRYLAGETAYAKVLEQSGDTVQAAQLRQDAATKQSSFAGESCRDCTISIMALR